MGVQEILADLRTCSRTKDIQRGKQVHSAAIQRGHNSLIHVANSLINMYARCGSMVHARQVFDKMKHTTVVSWNVLILGYAENGQGLIALDLFQKMKVGGPAPNRVTFLAALKACSSLAGVIGFAECRDRGKEIHHLVLENGCNLDIYVASTLIDMYAKCGSMIDARQIFDGLKHPNVVSWSALILGYADNGQCLTALDLFRRMINGGLAPNRVTFLAALKACGTHANRSGTGECRDRCKELHDLAVMNGYDSDIYVQNTLIDMYSKCRNMTAAQKVFDSVENPNVVSWTALILGYAENGQGLIALDMFTKMRIEGPTPNTVTLAVSLKSCGLVGGLDFGRTIHSEIITRDNDLHVVLVNSLVDFYAKCGSLDEARKVFDLHKDTSNIITWTALLSGFSNIGDHESVFGLFEEMQDAGFDPDSVTFLTILACCGHAGLADTGKEVFDTMSSKYGIVPAVEHYNCMVDIFGRANKLDDAMDCLQSMSCSPNDVTWTAILDACRKWKNVNIGRLAFQCLITLNDMDMAVYILMGQIYGSRGMLQEQEMVMGLKKELKAWKRPAEACWTNEIGQVHSFMAVWE